MTTNVRRNARWTRGAARLALVSLTAVATAALVTACGGGGGGGGTSVTPDRCSVNAEKQFVLDAARSWYLFPELLPANVNIASYATADDLLDALTAQARAQGKDRFYSYLTTRQEDQALFGEGEFVGFGFRSRVEGSRLLILDAFENTPASDGGLRRGAEILAIDYRDGRGYVPMSTILVNDPDLTGAFGPATVGVQRGFRYRVGGATTEVTLTKRLNTITPISPDGGVRVLSLPLNPSVQVGYVALRTFISTAQAPLLDAFEDFRQRGIDYFIVDLRYNGGGLVSVGDLLGDLLGGDRRPTDLYAGLRFNPARASNNENRFFQPRAESITPLKIAFITTGSTASASEMTINSMDPWPVEVAIVGSDTFGKPVGQSAFDLSGCDTRLRLVTFRTVNVLERGDYYNGLADEVLDCAADDDEGQPMGDPVEASTAAALAWIGNSSTCSAMTAAAGMAQQKLGVEAERRYPVPERPTPAQLWLPGLF
ncbi:MAG: S41 family peptidase [Steroidobacteraceae bacterium]|jgi:C-terminal processing protease CtpA/Prc|nr:S41 family peptidase [Steroidobacteraceae bacterium]